MNTAQALDFARHIIPWVQEHSKLQRKGMKLPEIQMLDDVEAFIRQTGTPESYNHTHQPKEIRQCEKSERKATRSTAMSEP